MSVTDTSETGGKRVLLKQIPIGLKLTQSLIYLWSRFQVPKRDWTPQRPLHTHSSRRSRSSYGERGHLALCNGLEPDTNRPRRRSHAAQPGSLFTLRHREEAQQVAAGAPVRPLSSELSVQDFALRKLPVPRGHHQLHVRAFLRPEADSVREAAGARPLAPLDAVHGQGRGCPRRQLDLLLQQFGGSIKFQLLKVSGL